MRESFIRRTRRRRRTRREPSRDAAPPLCATLRRGPYPACHERGGGQVVVGHVSEETVTLARAEAALYLRLDHPNCHYLLGAKTTLVTAPPLPASPPAR